ncbi:macrophage mannose receptor 1-like [Sycon ciliatum]|uniref:macrophage mannose receptor 1-like n=1 Tax=Sycon ciliatum TaxID=27933 RepID=UPI0031F6BE66
MDVAAKDMVSDFWCLVKPMIICPSESTYRDALWIGLTHSNKDEWLWPGSTDTITYSNWGCGQPSTNGNENKCTTIGYGANNDNSGLWSAESCTEKLANYICQMHVPLPTPCSYGWEYNAPSDACYKTLGGHGSYHNSERKCNAIHPGAHLPMILSDQENEFIATMIRRNHPNLDSGHRDMAWIALVRTNGVYKWRTGQPYYFSNFNCKRLDTFFTREHYSPCVVIKPSGLWFTYTCDYRPKLLLCKYNVSDAEKTNFYQLNEGHCSAGSYEFRGRCWLFQHTDAKDFNGARADCKTRGGDLAVVRDSYDSSFIMRHVSRVPN